ncbi:hypothetical protein BGZ82_006375 [Podila clonocystis]|nr:hypothetical protein BGZ82_006375 [Podila clonocystis]
MATSIRKAFVHPNGARLLCLDGGGVRGIASLIVLDEIMKRVKLEMGLSETPLPFDYFELAAGTSAGGINAIMLFRLRMTTEQAKEQYHIIAKEMFRPTFGGRFVPTWMEGVVNTLKLVFLKTRFGTSKLEKAIDSVVEKYGLDATDKAKKGQAQLYHPGANKMFVCTTVQNKMETALLRSYVKSTVLPLSGLNDIVQLNQNIVSISLAVKATSAAPTYFPEVSWEPVGVEGDLIFWDGGLLNNNPIDRLWCERHDVVAPDASEPPISCVISLGTGHKKPGSKPSLWFRLIGIASSVMSFATTTNAKDKNFESHMLDLNGRPEHKKTKYIRFDPPLEHDIGLTDYRRIDELAALTNEYLQRKDVQEKLGEAVEAICPKPLRDSPKPLRDSLLSP